MIRWRVGDIGRFAVEDERYPRFEVISGNKETVSVWYSGQSQLTTIPTQTLRQDCVKWWTVGAIDQVTPPWLLPHALFNLSSPRRSLPVIITQITSKGSPSTIQAIDAQGVSFQFRRRQMDYVSCLTVDRSPNILLLIPLSHVIAHGRPVATRWDVIRNLNVVDMEEDDF